MKSGNWDGGWGMEHWELEIAFQEFGTCAQLVTYVNKRIFRGGGQVYRTCL